MSYTKGRWTAPHYTIYASQHARAEYPIHAPKRGRIARAYRKGDAVLMSAAPDLLEALEAMLTHMGMDEDEWNKPTFDQARAAIKKARG